MRSPFRSWMMGGFECSTHHRADGRRLDLIAATRHDRHAAEDYRQLGSLGIRTVRDGVRWHLVEAAAGVLDWSSLSPMLAAAHAADTQVIWDLLHYGWPDWTGPWEADFAERFAAFAGAAAARIGPGGCYVPVNEISFLAWGGGEVGCMDPFAVRRGSELKRILCRAAILATRAIRAADPAATIVSAEPLIRVHPAGDTAEDRALAAALDAAQFEAVDTLLGRRDPALGGDKGLIDVIGINYYPHNQWWPGDPVRTVPTGGQVPLAELLVEAWQRYGKPILIAETGCEDDARGPWLDAVAGEADRAMAAGVPVVGLCLYPVMDHPGWADDRHCRNGMLCGFDAPPRAVFAPLARRVAASAEGRSAARIVLVSAGGFVADYAAEGLRRAGAMVVTDDEGEVPCHAAVLDLGMEREALMVAADRLGASGVPMVLIGEARAQVPVALRAHPVLRQPFASFQLVEYVRAVRRAGAR